MSILVKLSIGVDATWHPVSHGALAPDGATGIIISAVKYAQLCDIILDEYEATKIWSHHRQYVIDNVPTMLWKTYAYGPVPKEREEINHSHKWSQTHKSDWALNRTHTKDTAWIAVPDPPPSPEEAHLQKNLCLPSTTDLCQCIVARRHSMVLQQLRADMLIHTFSIEYDEDMDEFTKDAIMDMWLRRLATNSQHPIREVLAMEPPIGMHGRATVETPNKWADMESDKEA